MRVFRPWSTLSIVAVAVLVSVPANPAVRIPRSHLEVARQKMSPDARRGEIIADLTAVLGGPGISWNEVATYPYLSKQGGLCRRDVVKLTYMPAGKDPSGALKPMGMSAVYPQYHFIDEKETRSRADWEKACARLSGNKVYWATGDDDDKFAYNALVLLKIAVADVRKNAGANINCGEPDSNYQGPDSNPLDFKCGSPVFLEAASKVLQIRRCDEPRIECYAFSMGGYDVSIMWNPSGNKPSTVIKMSRTNDIIIT